MNNQPISLRDRLRKWYYELQLWRLGRDKNADYKEYLQIQYQRTLSKMNRIQPRVEELVNIAVDHIEDTPRKAVLCIGCRNTGELDEFIRHNFQSVVGIDLISVRSDIKIMDMHNMTFEDNQFDVIYSSHSLEHAIDVPQVVREIKRVARPDATIIIEVPIDFEPRGSDLIDFGSVEGVLAYFEPDVQTVRFQNTVTDDSNGTRAARVIFTL